MAEDDASWHHHLESTTRSVPDVRRQLDDAGVPGLTILCHPDTDRVGEVAVLAGLLSGGEESLSRAAPYFAQPVGGKARPLADPHISRRPIRFSPISDGGLRIDPGTTQLVIDDEPVLRPLTLGSADLEYGAILVVNQRATLLLHTLEPSKRPPEFGLVGESPSMLRLRREIERLAGLDFPVLLRGESGTGKELVARALHHAGPRRDRPCVSINVGAIPSSLAAAELFGTTQGAFTGANRARSGHFQRADGGTLFLDEIGDATADLQVLLLRALETGQIQPLGAPEPQKVDVRLISATDVDLEAAMQLGEIRGSLFHRLSTCELVLPPLRHRRDDIARLFFHFLEQEFAAVRAAKGLEVAPEGFSVDAGFMARLAAYDWPGNVRELRNVVRQLTITNWGQDILRLPPHLEPRLALSTNSRVEAASTAAELGATEYRLPGDLSERELLQALRENRWNVQRAAAAIRVARSSLYRWMSESPRVRKASDLSRAEVTQALDECGGKLEATAERLEVSKRGLQLRISDLGLGARPRSA